RIGVTELDILGLLRWINAEVEDMHVRLPAHPVVHPDFTLIGAQPNPVLVELPRYSAGLAGDVEGIQDLPRSDVANLKAVDPEEIAVGPRLSRVDGVRPADAREGADLLDHRVSASVDHVDEFGAFRFDVDPVA